jgi:uncharacterized protein (DUF58 family)
MTQRQSGLAALLLSLLLLGGVLLRQAVWITLAVVLLLAVLLAEVWRRWCLTKVTYRRLFSSRYVPFGEEIEYVVEITNRKLLPLVWIETEDELPAVLAPVRGRVTVSHRPHRCLLTNLLALRPYEEVRRHYRLACTSRGEHVFGPLTLRSGDMFGLVSREAEEEGTDRLVVYPRILPVHVSGVAARRLLGDDVVHASLFSDPSRVAGVREYLPGDSVRQIHWPATARAQRLQIKRYDPVGVRRLSLCVDIDTNPEGRWWAGCDPDLQELVLMVAASLAEWAGQQGVPVGLYGNGKPYGDITAVQLAPSAQPERRRQVLELLGRLMPYPTGPVAQALQSGAIRRPSGATVLLVTGLLYASKVHALGTLARSGHSVVAVLVGDTQESVGTLDIPLLHLADHQVHWREQKVVRLV